ncbi:MAG: isoprenylcysteine carboxylmethyltransferase family protein [Polyangiaceae bacterium]
MGKTKAVVAGYVGVLVFAAFLFLAAGKLVYWQAILYVALALFGATLSNLLVPKGSDLPSDRADKAAEGQSWDKRLLGAHALTSVVMFVVAGLDSGRFGWSGSVPVAVTIAGALMMVVGQVLFAVAKRQNAFFSSTARIQTERGHRVCDTGLYSHVRHPGYVGMLLSGLAFPAVLGAYWAFLPAACGAALLIARTALEDRMLRKELPGYPEYAARTRWRLVPGLY